MTLTSVKDLFRQTASFADQTVRVGGWVRSTVPVRISASW